MYETRPRTEVSQGDIFDSLPIISIQQGPRLEIVHLPAMLLCHDCEYDKPSTTAQIVLVQPFTILDKNKQNLIRNGKVISAFYLAAHDDILPESYVDLRYMTTLDKDIIRRASLENKRLVSLTDLARQALQGQIGLYFGIDRDRR